VDSFKNCHSDNPFFGVEIKKLRLLFFFIFFKSFVKMNGPDRANNADKKSSLNGLPLQKYSIGVIELPFWPMTTILGQWPPMSNPNPHNILGI
jgi:hypothetical protein